MVFHQRVPRRRGAESGFTLIICVILMSLLMVLAVGLMTLASLELRKTSRLEASAIAKGNARLALMQAIGQLQGAMGPDQRVSATAAILGPRVNQPHWTGVWKTTLENGEPFFTRDDLNGSLRDQRWEQQLGPASQVMEWLVSGDGDPSGEADETQVLLHGVAPGSEVSVPKITLSASDGTISGHLAWWTGDLGVRANLQTTDPRSDTVADRKNPQNGGLYRVMASQAADMKLMYGGVDLDSESRERMASSGTMAFSGAEKDWPAEHSLDFTTDSSGVLADVVNGRLKQDLTSYFENGAVPPFMNLPGLADNDSLVGAAKEDEGSEDAGSGTEGRYAKGGPRFGLLRDWARLGVPFSGMNVEGRQPEFDKSAGLDSAARALSNELPVKLAGNKKAGLQPILVEATNFTQISVYQEPEKTYRLRQLMYPRVVLWNPYNCDLKFDRSIIMIQGNGRQEMWTRNRTSSGGISISQWLNFEGGRTISFFEPGGIMNSSGYDDPYMGSYYFSIPATTFGPGECLVFSPARTAEYDGYSYYRQGTYNLNSNVLSCEVSPDPSRTYYVSGSDVGSGMNYLPFEFWYGVTPGWSQGGRNGVENQSDDTRAILKMTGNATKITFEDFDKLPQAAVLSGSLQFGAGREPRIQWNKNDPMPVELLDKFKPKPTLVPDVRTREGIRLRWFDEHDSNKKGLGELLGKPLFDDALLANWNPRASYIIRSPWENIGGIAPWFFGAYTRDLFDGAVSWDDQVPVPRKGRYHGNPFGPPQEGNTRYVLFDVPREQTGLVSLGQLQHAKLSELIWHPSYAIGNSLADPRLGTGGFKGLNRTAALPSNTAARKKGGFASSELGWSNDTQRGANKEDWAETARAILGDVPEDDNLVYDLSFEVNQKIWDRFFLSSGTPAAKTAFLADPFGNPLPNSRMRLAPGVRTGEASKALVDFHRSASQLMVDGAFNVNSTRVEAWKAMLGSTRMSGFGSSDKVPFPRVLSPPGEAWTNGEPSYSDDVWSGYRELTTDEIDRLAEAIVAEVKQRGPFVSMADFVNRRLAEDETGKMGVLQAAIENAGLNSGLNESFPFENYSSLPNYAHPDNIPDPTRMEQTLKPASKAWGAPVYLTQADVLQVLGPALSVRSDTFVIRAYGDAVDKSGKIQSRAWCEAVLQRTPRPIAPDKSGLNSINTGKEGDFGREFIITSFRWLRPDEV